MSLRALPFLVTLVCLTACSEPEKGWQGGTVWGPIEQGSCVAQEGLRRYSADLFRGSSKDNISACSGPAINIMGAHFAHPHSCKDDTAIWHVADTTCTAVPPTIPTPGAKGVPDEPAEGYADLHNHLLAHIAFGETVLWGAAYGEPEDALTPIPEELRAAHQRVEALSSARSITGIFDSHDEQGHPTYTGWPTPALKTHQQSHVDWLHRAYQGGLRLVVVHAVNNQDMFSRGENRWPSWLKWLLAPFGSGAEPAAHRTSNDMEALEHQIRAAHQLADWVREHRGGWLEIAETPEEASELIRAGKMALVLGSEVDHPLNCDLDRHCDEAHIREGLTKLEALGLAVIFPTHHKETQFGDSANFQPLNTGPLRPCPAFTSDCAAIGLSPKGEYLVQEMMARGLLVDLGHAGDKPFDDVMRWLEPERYPVLMTHAAAHPLKPNGAAEYTLTLAQLRRIAAVQGMSSLHSSAGEFAGFDNAGATTPFASAAGGGGYYHAYAYTQQALQSLYMDPANLSEGGRLAFAADWNGFAGWPFGRFGSEAPAPRLHEASGTPLATPRRLEYPLPLPSNLVPAAVDGMSELPLMKFEGMTFDFNLTGLAHAGLSPDLLADMRLHGLSEADLDPFYRSARGFVNMWQRAREATPTGDRGWLRWLPPSPTDLIDFEYLDRSRIVEVKAGRPICRRRATGAIGTLIDERCETIIAPVPTTPHETVSGEIRNANSGYCLTATDTGKLIQRKCEAQASQSWTFSPEEPGALEGNLALTDSELCLHIDGSNVTLDTCDARSHVVFSRIGNTFHLLSSSDQNKNKSCLHVEERSLEENTTITTKACPPPGRADFHWEFDALRTARDSDVLFSTRLLTNSIHWLREPENGFKHKVTNAEGRGLCRRNGQLGLEREMQSETTPNAKTASFCEIQRLTHNNADGNSTNQAKYERLFSNAPVRL